MGEAQVMAIFYRAVPYFFRTPASLLEWQKGARPTLDHDR
jgi:hypothetical protein